MRAIQLSLRTVSLLRGRNFQLGRPASSCLFSSKSDTTVKSNARDVAQSPKDTFENDGGKTSERKLNDNASTVEEDTGAPEPEMVDMWNDDAPNGPEWGGPRGYEPTRHGDWAKGGRVSDF